ncbi:MAG: protein-disulfide reductase DsbD [Pseudomonadota bacterium]|nr:protein-disulfide reductase DsbD [Pseudomonadota bacterium]
MSHITKTLVRLHFAWMLCLTLVHAPAAIGQERFTIGVLNDLFAAEEQAPRQFLTPDEAFRLESEAMSDGTLLARWIIEPGYYLYQEQLGAEQDGQDLIAMGRVEIPSGKPKTDEYFGETHIYTDLLEIRIQPIAGAGPITLTYQGCADGGICYAPQEQIIELERLTTTAPTAPAGSTEPTAPFVSEQDRLVEVIASTQLGLIAMTFFGLGLLLAFTPCVLPMVPILSAVIVGAQTQERSTARALSLSLAYVLAMALAYTAAGIFAGLFGANLQAFAQHPAVLIGFSAIFVALALSMFGLYELQLPGAIRDRVDSLSRRQHGGTLTGAAVMGLLSALIVGPCLAPPLAGALIYIGQSGDAVLGGLALFSLSLGMGVPLIVVGVSTGGFLPKAGPWMETVKAAFGVLLLGVAIWLLQRIIPAEISLLSWGGLAIATALLLGAFRSATDTTPLQKLIQGLGLSTFVYGVILIISAASGGDRLQTPLAHLRAPSDQSATLNEVEFVPIKSFADLQREITRASSESRYAILDFYADWCVDCIKMERETFNNPEVASLLSSFRLLQADVTRNDATDRELMRQLDVIGPPTLLIFNQRGDELPNYRILGFMEPNEFVRHLREATRADSNRRTP